MTEKATDTGKVSYGRREVTPAEKTRLVQNVFAKVAARYDTMNDIMSLGTHRLFKPMAVEMTGLAKGDRVLDLAGGTGDMTALLRPVVGDNGLIILADLNADMMRVGRDRLLHSGIADVSYCRVRAESLPFRDQMFNAVTISFGIRNFTSKETALDEICRVLKPGGVLVVLEFSHPDNPLFADLYRGFQTLWPAFGKRVVGDEEPYRYLVESIEKHPRREALALMFEDAGFSNVTHHPLAGGVAAIHRGVKP
ncbi:MAG: class I SAM-dependent methyltransferase [Gammaproteobacteria bacterium]|nr:class I SAM-dependent methyltransferase [Gammaproteobacteria bacterium]